MGYENITVNEEQGLGTIRVNRPDKLNALNIQTVEELHSAFLAFRDNPEVKAIILTGSGDKAFIAGADIGELAKLDKGTGRVYVLKGQEMTKQIENFPKPVIAAVNGFALGGGTEVALACHVRIASDNAKMGQPEVKLGLIPGFGACRKRTGYGNDIDRDNDLGSTCLTNWFSQFGCATSRTSSNLSTIGKNNDCQRATGH